MPASKTAKAASAKRENASSENIGADPSASPSASPSTSGDARLRIDKWLWYARFFKTRSLAAKAVQGGVCRINRERVSKPGATVRAGDVLTFAQSGHVRVIEVVAMGVRRGPAPEAANLYKDLDPPQKPSDEASGSDAKAAQKAMVPQREPGAGRPTKRDRRQLDRVMGEFQGVT